MKKIILLLLIIAGFVSCNNKYIETYYYQNESGYDIVIEGYRSKDRRTDIELPYKDIYIYIYDSDPEKSELEPFEIYDKVRIVFNNERALVYYYGEYEGIYGNNNYVHEPINKHDTNHYYTFTPEMYEEALPLEDAEVELL